MCIVHSGRPVHHSPMETQIRTPDASRGNPPVGGWRAVMAQAKYGGSGFGLAEASIVIEEIKFPSGNSGAVHGHVSKMHVIAP